jgi:ribosome recycling factor
VPEKVFQETEGRMKSAISSLQKELASIRTGLASLALLDGIEADYFGTLTPLKQLASVTVPEKRLLAVQPWDKSIIGSIEKAILSSDLGLNPVNDGKIIRIPIPPLTEDRRKQLAKLVKKAAEKYRVSIRTARREGNEALKRLEKEKTVGEDDLHRAQERLQKLTDQFTNQVDTLADKKEKEVTKV